MRSYHAWTLLDNFEWADGYSLRYGLTYVGFRNQRRTIKNSGLWYGRSLRRTGLTFSSSAPAFEKLA